ncbi:DUF3793 family protein [Pectinatus haikarae]|uniref:DUF3793 domain-containing protein n=1 Tax=Pectinatus haikarae TaxID=349096 RepID=A0ABT9Y627_9FIRM|nr:DUF3793 family protein [Pectinatus haikarae]MDQ0203288.1 hypothetical protein [Pectinatus haikarae]
MESFKKFEHLLAFHCAPTLAGIKSGNLISINKNKINNFRQIQQKYRKCLSCNDVFMFTVSDSQNYRLLMIYHKTNLAKILSEADNQTFLKSYGYKDFSSVISCLRYLKIRMHLQKGFPHEIGLFLGYPLPDVEGFIKNNGQNFKYCGQWKVYSDIESAERLFSQYTKCCTKFCSSLAEGKSLENIIETAV